MTSKPLIDVVGQVLEVAVAVVLALVAGALAAGLSYLTVLVRQPVCGSAAADRAGGAAPSLRAGLAAAAFPRAGRALVRLASPPRSTCQTGAHPAPATESRRATLLLGEENMLPGA